MTDNTPAGAIPGYEGSEAEADDFIGMILGEVAPVTMIEKLRGTEEAIKVAQKCPCEHCDAFLAEHGLERTPADPGDEGFQA